MGNSLLDITVFGRLAGESAGKFAVERKDVGNISVEHVRQYHKELEASGIITDRVSPMVLPDYANPEVKRRQLTTTYVGSLR
jgi:succinate dehydrogenase/fumarate reductase flavoprotein subunit